MTIRDLDHVALPTDRPDELIDFYRGLGFHVLGEHEWRTGTRPTFSLALTNTKLNVHPPAVWKNPEFTLRGPTARPGCADLCFVFDGTVEDAIALLGSVGAPIIDGPAERVGGRRSGLTRGVSVYTRDPDGNLIELIAYE